MLVNHLMTLVSHPACLVDMSFVMGKVVTVILYRKYQLIHYRCLSSLKRPICPYCRQPFKTADGKVVHMHAELSESDWHRVPGSQEDQRAQQFQRQILRTVDGAGVVSDTMRELISTATEWLRSKPSHLVSILNSGV